MKTKAVLFPEANKFELCELTLPELGKKDVAVRTLTTAISPGTERWILRGKHQGTMFPCIPGYQRIGIVEECGQEVKNLQVGDTVYTYGSAAAPASWKEKNINSMWGAHIGYSIAPADAYTFLSSKTLSKFELETLAFTILIGVANRGIRFCNPSAGQKIAIIGGGIIGLSASQLATLLGSDSLIVEKDLEKIEFIKKIGLNVISVDDANFNEKLKEFAPDGLNILYDTVGYAPTTDMLVQSMKIQGTLLLQAQYFNQQSCAIDIDQIKNREITVKTTIYIDNKDFHDTKDNILTRRLQVAPLITHSFSADEILKGYELLHTGKPFNLGIVFHW